MDTIIFLCVLAISLLFVSLLLVFRLGAGGKTWSEICWVIGEMWLLVGLLTCLFAFMGGFLGPTGGPEANVLDRFSVMGSRDRALSIAGWVVAIGLFAHLLRIVNRAMREASPDQEE